MRIIIALVVIASYFICYMEWGGGNHAFVAEAAYELLIGQPSFAQSLSHPLVLFSLAGLLLIIHHGFMPIPKRWILITGTIVLSALPAMIFLSGILSANIKMVLSVIPFLIACIINVRYNKKCLAKLNRQIE